MSYNEAETRYHMIDPVLREKDYTSAPSMLPGAAVHFFWMVLLFASWCPPFPCRQIPGNSSEHAG